MASVNSSSRSMASKIRLTLLQEATNAGHDETAYSMAVIMMRSLSRMLYGSEDAAFEQPTALDMQDTEDGLDVMDVTDHESSSVTDNQSLDDEPTSVELEDVTLVQLEQSDVEDDEQTENRSTERHMANTVQPPCRRCAQAVQTGCEKLARYNQRQQQASMSENLNRKHLKLCNKARMVQSCGREPASKRNRVLRPSGWTNSRQHKF